MSQPRKDHDAIHLAVLNEIQKHFVSRATAEMVARWVVGGLVSPQGRFIVTKISRVAFKVTRRGYHLTANCRLLVAPAFETEVSKKYEWAYSQSKGKYAGNIS